MRFRARPGHDVDSVSALDFSLFTECDLTEKNWGGSRPRGMWSVGRGVPVPTGGWVWGGCAPSPEKMFSNFQVKVQGFMHLIAKNYLWPENGTGLIDPMGLKM